LQICNGFGQVQQHAITHERGDGAKVGGGCDLGVVMVVVMMMMMMVMMMMMMLVAMLRV